METVRTRSESRVGLLEAWLGKNGIVLWNKANGIDESPVVPYHEQKSISTESTFPTDTIDLGFIHSELVRMTEKVAYEHRQDDKMTGCITVKIRYHNFETTSRQISIPYTFYDDELIAKARELFGKLYRKGQAVRLLGVRLSELTNEAVQTNLFDNTARKNALYKAIDDVKNKFGKLSITKAAGK